jgi:hypothetical protein
MTSYCLFCGKVARWPKTEPEACSMRCAAYVALEYADAGNWDAVGYCTECGYGVIPGHDCPRCNAEPEEVSA